MSSWGSLPSAGNKLMPVLAASRITVEPIVSGSASVAASRSMMYGVSRKPSSAAQTITNSSLPTRLAVSRLRIARPMRTAAAASVSSPAACPRTSLMFLKSLRSSEMTINSVPERCAAAIDWVSRSTSNVRFGSSVTASWLAIWSSRRAVSARSAASRSSVSSAS
jgi:hypothetical protein